MVYKRRFLHSASECVVLPGLWTAVHSFLFSACVRVRMWVYASVLRRVRRPEVDGCWVSSSSALLSSLYIEAGSFPEPDLANPVSFLETPCLHEL